MSHKFVRTTETKAGNCVVAYDVPAEDVMTKSVEELIHTSTSACHVSQTNVEGKIVRQNFAEEADYVVKVG